MRHNKDWIENRLDDPKPTFVSHIVRYGLDNKTSIPRIKGTFVYDVYKDISPETAFSDGWDALEELGTHLTVLAEEINPTHILFYSTGWNTDQQQSIQNYNSLVGNLMEAAAADTHSDKPAFRPLVVALSWPSFWDGLAAAAVPFSYVNKARDADEVGLLWGNLLLNHVIKKFNKGRDLPVIVIGHSFGARLTTTATFAYPLLPEANGEYEASPTPDLVIGLEGALSINRLHGTWKEQYSRVANSTLGFKDFAKVKAQFVYVGSAFDSATSTAPWAPFLGAPQNYAKYAKNHPDKVTHTFISCDGEWTNTPLPDKPKAKTICDDDPPKTTPIYDMTFDKNKLLLVDASRIIRHNQPFTGGGAHSDVYSPEVGKLVWMLIRDFEAKGTKP